MKLGKFGELCPTRGFSRFVSPCPVPGQSMWRSHDDLIVVSSCESAYLPGSGDPPEVGPQWLVSVSRRSGGIDARCRVVDDDVVRVVRGFEMPAFEEDNHHPGLARHLWCPIDERFRSACECKLTETTIVETSGYEWTTDDGEECRGCWYARVFGPPCPRHPTPSDGHETVCVRP